MSIIRQRNREILLWLSDDELQKLKANAKKCGLSQQKYLRFLINNITPKEQPPMQFYDVLKQLRQINVNVNQIAMRAHTLNFIDAPFYESCHKELQEAIGKIMGAVY